MYTQYIALIIGIIWMLIIFVTILIKPNPSDSQMYVFRVILAIAAAGIGGIIPGFINIEYGTIGEVLITAGGAIVLFIIVYLLNPPKVFQSLKS